MEHFIFLSGKKNRNILILLNYERLKMKYTKEEHKILLKLAKDSIIYGLKHNKIMPIDLAQYPENLQALAACFVTLKINGELRGCIGSLVAHQPLAQDLIYNSYAAAFEDPRFKPLTENELQLLDIHISVLNKPELVHFTSEQDLIKQLRPNIDGLILSEGILCGTFLPSVWKELTEPTIFLYHLKLKAGLPGNYWSKTIKVERYTVENITNCDK